VLTVITKRKGIGDRMYGIYENGSVIAKFAAPTSVVSSQPILTSDTLSLKRYSSTTTAQRWEIDSNLEPLSYTSNELFANIVEKGNTEVVTVAIPQNYGVIHNITSTGVAQGGGAIGEFSVSVTQHAGFLPRGCFIKFANHSKIYMTTSSLTNTGTLNLYPALRIAVPGGTVISYSDVLMNAYYDTSVIRGMSFTDGILMDMGTIKLIEAL